MLPKTPFKIRSVATAAGQAFARGWRQDVGDNRVDSRHRRPCGRGRDRLDGTARMDGAAQSDQARSNADRQIRDSLALTVGLLWSRISSVGVTDITARHRQT